MDLVFFWVSVLVMTIAQAFGKTIGAGMFLLELCFQDFIS